MDELVSLYQRASSHLSTARAAFGDAPLERSLTSLVARAHGLVYGTRPRTWGVVVAFFRDTFPAALWHLRREVVVASALFLAAFAAVAVWIATSPAAAAAIGPEEVVRAYLEEDFEAYYSSQPAGQFAALVFTNNARVGILAFATGILACIPTAIVLAFNGANVGVAAGLFHAAGEAGRFWGLILPHGLLELTAVFVAGGTGLRLGWTLLVPGDRRRSEALAEEGQRAVVVVIGLVLVFLVAGLLEAFITPSRLPTAARVGTGLLVEIAFLAYVISQGRAAAARGRTGALRETAQLAHSGRR